jgi:hypothetical protein
MEEVSAYLVLTMMYDLTGVNEATSYITQAPGQAYLISSHPHKATETTSGNFHTKMLAWL